LLVSLCLNCHAYRDWVPAMGRTVPQGPDRGGGQHGGVFSASSLNMVKPT